MMSSLYLKLGAAVLVLLLLAGITLSIYNKGKAAGRVEGAAEQLQQDRAQFEQDRAAFLGELKRYEEKDDAAKVVIAQKDSEIAELRSRRVAARAAIDRLPDAALVGDIQQRLGVPASPTLLDSHLRSLDEILADYQNLQAQVAALEAKSAEQDKRIAAIEHQRDAAIAAYNNLVPLYSKAYNASQKKHSMFVKIITFGLVRDKKMDLPPPASLGKLQ